MDLKELSHSVSWPKGPAINFAFTLCADSNSDASCLSASETSLDKSWHVRPAMVRSMLDLVVAQSCKHQLTPIQSIHIDIEIDCLSMFDVLFAFCTQKWIIIGSGLEDKEVQTKKKNDNKRIIKQKKELLGLNWTTQQSDALCWTGPLVRDSGWTGWPNSSRSGDRSDSLKLKLEGSREHSTPICTSKSQLDPIRATNTYCQCKISLHESLKQHAPAHAGNGKQDAKTTTAKSCAPCGGQHSSKMTATATETPWRLFETDKLNTDKGGKGTKTLTFERFSASQLAWHTCLIPKGDGKEYTAPTCLTKHPECWSLKVQLLKMLKSRSKKYNERPKIKQWRRQRDARVEAVAGEVAPCVHQHIDVIAAPSCQRCSSQLNDVGCKRMTQIFRGTWLKWLKCIQVHVGLHVVTINHN